MKKVVTLLSFFLLAIFLFGCNDDETKVSLQIEGINGHNDAIIDNENKSVSFNVDNSIASFDLEDIILPENILVSVYEDSNLEQEISNVLDLEVGLNTYYMYLYFAEDDEFNSTWTLNITRLAASIKSISVKELKSVYTVNEEFSDGTLTVTYTDNSTEDIKITTNMVLGFDTKTLGKKELTIVYEGFTIKHSYEVVNEIEKIEVLDLKKEYFLDESFVNGKLKLYYSDNSTKEIDLTTEMVKDFDTSTVGKKTLTITYEGKTTTYEIEVIEDVKY